MTNSNQPNAADLFSEQRNAHKAASDYVESRLSPYRRPLRRLFRRVLGTAFHFPNPKIFDEFCSTLSEVLATLTSLEEKVITLRYCQLASKTQEDVGENLGYSQPSISRIERKALAKLRHPSRSRRLKLILEGN